MTLEDIKFELEYFWDNKIRIPYIEFREGIKNFWKFRKVIWNYRWWDSSFFMNIQKVALKDMKENWHKNSYSCDDWNQTQILYRLVEILDEIEELENDTSGNIDDWIQNEEKINKLYEEYGQILFGIREFEYYCDGKKDIERKTSAVRILWD